MMTARNMKCFIHFFKKYYYRNVNQAWLERPLAESLGTQSTIFSSLTHSDFPFVM